MNSKKKDKVPDSNSRCKICGSPIPEKRDTNGPFCSHRCRLQDLSKWFGENYRIASSPVSSRDTDDDSEIEH